MSLVYCIRTRQKGKHLIFEEREEIEALVNKNNAVPKKERMSQRQMAKRLGISPATLSRELKRGQVVLRDYEWCAYIFLYISLYSLKNNDKIDKWL